MTSSLKEGAEWCRRLGSPLYTHLMTRCAEDYEAGGPVRQLLEPLEQDPPRSLAPLRMMGAVHRLVLEGRAPELAGYYPSAGGSVDLDRAWAAFRETVAREHAVLAALVPNPVQTNDAGRSGSLLGGFLTVASSTGLPLRLLEIGSSAGLNLCWDRFRYDWPGGGWGDAASPMRLENVFVNGAPSFPPEVKVVSRAGCDLNPIDPRTPEGRLTLLSYMWADHVERIRTLEAAIEVARRTPYTVEASGAADWLERLVAEPAPGAATVVFHSVVWGYLDASEQQRITALMDAAGARGTAAAPLAWLRMEMGGGQQAEVRLRIDPGFADRAIAITSFHRPAVEWIASV
jgi:hypothetical protein